MVLATCRRVLYPDIHSADDAFQAAFLVLATRASAIRPPERVGAWLHGVAVHAAMKARSWQRKISTILPDDLDKLPSTKEESNLDLAYLRRTIDNVLAGLPTKYSTPVILCELEGLSRAEAAAKLGWPEGTLSGRLARAKKLLADRLTRRGIELPAAGLAVLVADVAMACVVEQTATSVVHAAALVAAGAGFAEVAPASIADLTRAAVPATSNAFKVVAASIIIAIGGWGLAAILVPGIPLPLEGPIPTKGPPLPPPPGERAFANAPAFVPVPRRDLLPPAPRNWTMVSTLPSGGPVTAVAFGPGVIAVGDENGILTMFDAKTGKPKEMLLDGVIKHSPKPINRVQFSQDGVWMHIITDNGESIHECKVDKKHRDSFPSVGGLGGWIAFGTIVDGKYWLEHITGTGQLVLRPNGTPEGKIGGPAIASFKHETAVDYALAHDVHRIVSVTGARTKPVMRLWSLGHQKPRWSVALAEIAKIDVSAVVFSPTGSQIAVAGRAGQIWLFDADTGKQVGEIDNRSGSVSALSFSRDGRTLAAACRDGTARLFDVTSGSEIALLKEHSKPVTCIAFSDDGKSIATGSDDSMVKLWQCRDD
jgi:RNA polymerase sigma factor (sigma-70 family)